jgi:hypothetical protein
VRALILIFALPILSGCQSRSAQAYDDCMKPVDETPEAQLFWSRVCRDGWK